MRTQRSAVTGSLRQRALRLLARRDYTRAELEKKLLAALRTPADSDAERDADAFDDNGECADSGAIAALLDELVAQGFVADSRYAENRVRSRAGRYGDARLGNELRQRGVAADTVADALAAGGDEYSRALALWRRKFGRAPADAAERAKQMRHLASRGFSGETVRRVLRQSDNRAVDADECGESLNWPSADARDGDEPC